MKYYYLVGGMEPSRIYYILQSDTARATSKSRYLQPANVKLFWYKNDKVKDAAQKQIGAWESFGWEKDMVMTEREVVRHIFRISND